MVGVGQVFNLSKNKAQKDRLKTCPTRQLTDPSDPSKPIPKGFKYKPLVFGNNRTTVSL